MSTFNAVHLFSSDFDLAFVNVISKVDFALEAVNLMLRSVPVTQVDGQLISENQSPQVMHVCTIKQPVSGIDQLVIQQDHDGDLRGPRLGGYI